MFDIYTIIFLALAVFIFLRLRSVLGQRTGRERPPYDPYSSAPGTIRPAPATRLWRCQAAPPIRRRSPPSRLSRSTAGRVSPSRARLWPPGSTPSPGRTRASMPSNFLTGARAAYDMIVTAYAAGDRRQLKNLLGSEVYDGFETAIKEREQRGETVETPLRRDRGATLTAAEQRGKTAQVTVRFQSQLVSVTRAKDGAVIDGNPDKVTDVTDVWTFARDVSSRDPNWKLVATEAGQ